MAVRASPGCAAHCGEAWSADRAQSQGRSQPPQSTAERAGSQRPGSATAGRADRGTGSTSSLARPELPAAAAGDVWRLPAAAADHRAGRGVEPQLGGDLPAAFALAGTAPVVAGRAQRPEIGNDRVRGPPVPPARPAGVKLARPAVLAPGLALDPGGHPSLFPAHPAGLVAGRVSAVAAGAHRPLVLTGCRPAAAPAAHTGHQMRPAVAARAQAGPVHPVGQPPARPAGSALRPAHAQVLESQHVQHPSQAGRAVRAAATQRVR